MLKDATWVFLGGGLGTSLRWMLQRGLLTAGIGYPEYATAAVNFIGSLGLAALLGWRGLPASLQLWVGVGVFGGFTTYSTFNVELLRLLLGGAMLRAVIYAFVTFGICLLGGYLGFALSSLYR